jgi:hypothetical protein
LCTAISAPTTQCRPHIARGRIEVDIAEHRGDGFRRAAVGDQQQQRLRIVDAAVGVEDQPVHRHALKGARSALLVLRPLQPFSPALHSLIDLAGGAGDVGSGAAASPRSILRAYVTFSPLTSLRALGEGVDPKSPQKLRQQPSILPSKFTWGLSQSWWQIDWA